mmetsp:Transcript_33100/g.74802  ORF Transcript_33100/g.74802 Transcript_33100/m.74802 type:complete len:201 (-) Transcript_33100:61-663(-)
MVLTDLCKQLVGREGEPWDTVPSLRLGQDLLVGFLQRDEPSHQVIHVHHRHPDIGVDGADEGAGGRQPMLRLLVRRGQERIERVLCRAVAPHGFAVQDAGQDRKPRVPSVISRERSHQLPAAPLLPPVVRTRVLVGVLVQPARGRVTAWGRGTERSNGVGEADATRPYLLHRVEDVLHPAHRHGLGHRRVHGCFHRERRR